MSDQKRKDPDLAGKGGPPRKPQSSGQRQQQQGGAGQQYGEGSYSGTRQYNEGVKEHMEHHDIEREARDAAPKSDAEAREMQDAERKGRSKSRGEGRTPEDDGGAPTG